MAGLRYTLGCGTSGGGADMCPRCPEQRSALSYYTLDTPIFRRIAANTRRRVARQKKGAVTLPKKGISSRKYAIRDTRRIFPTFPRLSSSILLQLAEFKIIVFLLFLVLHFFSFL